MLLLTYQPTKKRRRRGRKRRLVAGSRERAYQVRAYPTKTQAEMLARLLGAKRFVWNWALRLKQEAWAERKENLSFTALSKAFTTLRAEPEHSWLSELPREPLQQTLRDLDEAFTNFFVGRAKYPRLKRRSFASAVRFSLDARRNQVTLVRKVAPDSTVLNRGIGRAQLDGVGRVKFKFTENLQGHLLSVTVRRDSAGRFFLSFTTTTAPDVPQFEPVEGAVGVDLGVSALATTSAGEKIGVSRALEVKERRLRRYQRAQARKLRAAMKAAGLDPSKPPPKGFRLERSKRFVRNGIRIGKLHAQVRDARENLVHQVTWNLVARYAIVAIEDLSIKGMQRGFKSLRKRVANACMGEFRRQLEYKARWLGRRVVVIDRYHASSKKCHLCHHVKDDLKLSDRRWVCPNCGVEHDRDVNAAKNILAEGLRILEEQSAGYREERGKLRARSVHEGSADRPTVRCLDTLNRELILLPAARARRRACREQAKAATG